MSAQKEASYWQLFVHYHSGICLVAHGPVILLSVADGKHRLGKQGCMIDPLRYRSVKNQQEFDEHDSPIQCWQCQQERVSTPAFFFCHECGKANTTRPYCGVCFFDYHLTRKKGKEAHKPHPIVRGDPVIVQTLADGDGTTFAKMHDWVTLDYTLTTDESDDIIEDTFSTEQPLIFQSGCSGPCIHLQLLGCTDIAAADILGSSDPYCAVYWKNDLVGVTTTKHMTLNPVWANQTFVLPLAADFMAALDNDGISSALFNAGALLPKLRVELYDWDRLSKNDFLGQASVSDADILRILRRASSDERDEDLPISFDLMPKLSRGKLGIRVALRGQKLFVHVVQAENVPKADPHSLSDPYCEVYWNDTKVGKTAHINNTLDPVWDLEIFAIRIDGEGPNSVEQSILRIECLDWDQFGSDDVLGQIELKGWQIKELAENGGGDGITSPDEGGALGEADMELIYDFVKTFQKHETEEGGLGKMIVGVPQDPNIQSQEQEPAEVTEVAPDPQKKKLKTKKKQKNKIEASAEATPSVGTEIVKEIHVEKYQRSVDIVDTDTDLAGVDAGRQTDEKKRAEKVRAKPREGGEDIIAAELAGVEGHLDGARDTDGQGEQGEVATTPNRDHGSVGQEQLRDGVIPRDDEDGERHGAKVSGNQENTPGNAQPSSDTSNASMLAAETGSVVDSQLPQEEPSDGAKTLKPAPEGQEQLPSAAIADARDVVGHQQSLEKRCDGAKIIEPVSEDKALMSPGTNAEAIPVAGASVEEEGGQGEKAPVKDDTPAQRHGRGHNSVAIRYRDASVQRFEEDRGVLVQYVDDNSTAWIATKFIPRLQIREHTPVARNLFQRAWDQRRRLFHLHKRVLNVKRGLKVLLELAMTGSRMQWYQLELTEEQSGANFVRGTVNFRFLYHTRGSVLRGLDVAVSHMSLGERARVEVRSDYGFGEVYAGRKVPPYATLVFLAQVAAIGQRSARWVILRRALRNAAGDALFRARLYASGVAASYGAARRLIGLFGGFRRPKTGVQRQDDLAEEKQGSVVADELPESVALGSEAEDEAVAQRRNSLVAREKKASMRVVHHQGDINLGEQGNSIDVKTHPERMPAQAPTERVDKDEQHGSGLQLVPNTGR